jgi:hypothetical protein
LSGSSLFLALEMTHQYLLQAPITSTPILLRFPAKQASQGCLQSRPALARSGRFEFEDTGIYAIHNPEDGRGFAKGLLEKEKGRLGMRIESSLS